MQKSFESVVKPVIEWLKENKNPHSKIIIDWTSAELLGGVESVVNNESVTASLAETVTISYNADAPVSTLGDACPKCGGCEWQCAECNGALGV